MRWPLQPLQPLQQTQLQPPFGQSVDSLCHLWFTTNNVSYRFPILKLPPPPCAVLLVHIIYYIIFFYNHKEFSLSDKAQVWPNRIASARHPYQLIVWDMWVLYRKKVAQLHCWLDMSSTMQHGTWEMKGTCSQTAQLCSHSAFGFSWISAALRQQNAAQSGEGWGTAPRVDVSEAAIQEVGQVGTAYHKNLFINHEISASVHGFTSAWRSLRQDCAFYFHFTDSDGSKSPGSQAKELCLMFFFIPEAHRLWSCFASTINFRWCSFHLPHSCAWYTMFFVFL